MTPGARGGYGYGRDDRDYPTPDPADDPERAWRDAAPGGGYPGYGGDQYPPDSGSARYPEQRDGGYQDPAPWDGGYGGYQGGQPPAHGYQNGGYPNGGYQNGGYPNGGYQNGGYPNGGYQNGQPYGDGHYPDGPAYGGQAYGAQGYQGQSYGGQGYEGQSYGGQGYDARGYAEPEYGGYPPEQSSGPAYGYRRDETSGYVGAPGRPDADAGDSYGSSAYGTREYGGQEYGGRAYPAQDDSVGYGRRSAEAGGRARAGVPPAGGTTRSARAEPEEPEPEPEAERRRGLPLWQELPLLLTIAFCLAILIRTFLLQAFFIPSGSMEDTLVAGDRVIVNKLVYNFREPQRGEVVVFRGTDAWAPLGDADDDVGLLPRTGRALGELVGVSRPGEKDYIKRIIGLPGDRVSCCDVDGRIYVNGEPLNEEYVIRDSPLDAPAASQDCRGRRFEEIVVEPGQMFVLGDHRLVSQDSRCQGQVPVENIIGRAFVIVWPNDRWAGLDAPNTFDSVPPPSATALPEPIPSEPGLLPMVLPVLLPVPLTIGAIAARSRLFGHHRRRRLAE